MREYCWRQGRGKVGLFRLHNEARLLYTCPSGASSTDATRTTAAQEPDAQAEERQHPTFMLFTGFPSIVRPSISVQYSISITVSHNAWGWHSRYS